MTDDVQDREDRVIALLQDNVRNEIAVSAGINRLGLTEAQIDTLMQAVTSELLYAFAIDWSPDWVKPGEVHSWQSNGDHFARCGVCLRDSPPLATPTGAVRWAHDHEAGHRV